MTSLSNQSVTLAASAADRELASHLRQALLDRGLVSQFASTSASEREGPIIVLCSAAAMMDPEFNAFIETLSVKSDWRRLYVVGIESDKPLLPMGLRAVRRSNGKFWQLPEPQNLGGLYTNAGSIEQMADMVVFACANQSQPSLPVQMLQALGQRPAMATLSMASAMLLGVAVWQADQLSAARQDAQDAQIFASRMLTDITERLPNDARQGTLVRLADDLTGAFALGDMSSVSTAEAGRRARLFHLIGEARNVHGDPDGAREAFSSAFGYTQTLLARAPSSPDRIFDHAQSAYWLGNQAYRGGEVALAATYFATYAELAEQLNHVSPGHPAYRAELGYAALNQGAVALDSGDAAEAAALFAEALSVFEAGLVEEGAIGQGEITNTYAWMADARLQAGDLAGARETREQTVRLYEQEARERPLDTSLQLDLAHTRQQTARLAMAMGDAGVGASLLDQALETLDALHAASPENDRIVQRYVTMVFDRANVALSQGEVTRAQLLLGEARRVAARGNETGETDHHYSVQTMLSLLAGEVALASNVYDRAVLEGVMAAQAADRALENGLETARPLLVRAYYLQAEAHEASGRQGEADRLYRAALTEIDQIPAPKPSDLLALQSRVAWRLGESQLASNLRNSLERQGYAALEFQRFWERADTETSVSAMTVQGG